jgi:HSP20 family protein
MALPAKRPNYDVFSWSPFDEMRALQDYTERMFSSLIGGNLLSDIRLPLIDVVDEADKITVTTDLPGVDKSDVELSIYGHILAIDAKNKKEEKSEKEGYVTRERSFVRYHREIPLTHAVNEGGIKAQMINGVLTITLPKAEIEEHKKIMIE